MSNRRKSPVDALIAEHRLIAAVLGSMEMIAHAIEGGAAPDVRAARAALRFMTEFADGLHHEKEEAILFPALGRLGVCATNQPFVMMCHEHEVGRAHVRRMAKFLDVLEHGASDGVARETAAIEFAREAKSFAALLRHHIARENDELFPMIRASLGSADVAALAAAFERTEREDFGVDARERAVEAAERLIAAWPYEPPEGAPSEESSPAPAASSAAASAPAARTRRR